MNKTDMEDLTKRFNKLEKDLNKFFTEYKPSSGWGSGNLNDDGRKVLRGYRWDQQSDMYVEINSDIPAEISADYEERIQKLEARVSQLENKEYQEASWAKDCGLKKDEEKG